MLRAMQQALQKHAEEHPNDPFDHERHMPVCMCDARGNSSTWASGGSRASSSSAADGHQVPTLRTLTLIQTLTLTLIPSPSPDPNPNPNQNQSRTPNPNPLP